MQILSLGGSQFGYKLLFIILLSSLMAMFLQYLSLKAGIATGRDLAQICRDSYHPYITTFLWIWITINCGCFYHCN
jgi:manganese transport protein